MEGFGTKWDEIVAIAKGNCMNIYIVQDELSNALVAFLTEEEAQHEADERQRNNPSAVGLSYRVIKVELVVSDEPEAVQLGSLAISMIRMMVRLRQTVSVHRPHGPMRRNPAYWPTHAKGKNDEY